MPSSVALIVEEPSPTPVARPAAEIVATPEADELHVAVLVRFCVLLSLNVPVAVNCCVFPTGIVESPGPTAIDTRVAAVTVRDVLPLTLPDVAVMVVIPAATPVASPVEFMVATLVAEELHCTDAVKSCVLLSLNVPSALS